MVALPCVHGMTCHTTLICCGRFAMLTNDGWRVWSLGCPDQGTRFVFCFPGLARGRSQLYCKFPRFGYGDRGSTMRLSAWSLWSLGIKKGRGWLAPPLGLCVWAQLWWDPGRSRFVNHMDLKILSIFNVFMRYMLDGSPSSGVSAISGCRGWSKDFHVVPPGVAFELKS